MSTRRQFLRASALGGAVLLGVNRSPSVASEPADFTPGQERMLDDVQRRGLGYFAEQSGATTGLVRDRARMTGKDSRRVSSIAATGFGLSVLCLAESRGYLQASQVKPQIEKALRFILESVPQKNGFLPHFLDVETGARVWKSEFSSIDTAWLLCGALHAGIHFPNGAISDLAEQLYQRVNWRWMLNGGKTLSHGWTPEHGFLPYRWDAYSELLAMYLLAIGSPSHPIPAQTWNAWRRPIRNVDNLSFIESDAPLFAHQFSHAWFDFRGRRDRYADYFENSRLATEAHRLLCLELAPKYPWFNQGMWGVTASDSRRGYLAWGMSRRADAIDGTLVPCAAAGSLPFLPGECASVLENMLAHYGDRCFGRYGFVDAFHPKANWYDLDVVGIDQGITVLMAENSRTGLIWDEMSSSKHVTRAFSLVQM